jgi:hypothetical protein
MPFQMAGIGMPAVHEVFSQFKSANKIGLIRAVHTA